MPEPAVSQCGRCGKALSPGVRYCIACGHNNFEADAAAAKIGSQIHKRQEQAARGLRKFLRGFLPWI